MCDTGPLITSALWNNADEVNCPEDKPFWIIDATERYKCVITLTRYVTAKQQAEYFNRYMRDRGDKKEPVSRFDSCYVRVRNVEDDGAWVVEAEAEQVELTHWLPYDAIQLPLFPDEEE